MPGNRVYTSHYRRGQAGGLALIVSEEFGAAFDRIHLDEVVPERIVVLRCRAF